MSAADLFYANQAMFAALPFAAIIAAFLFWYVFGIVKREPFFAKRKSTTSITPKDRFIVTVGLVIYLIFPQLCSQAFEIFNCMSVSGRLYLVKDLDHECYKDAHLAAAILLGASQFIVFVVGLPALMLFFLRRNRRKKDGLKRRVVLVRYGLFFGA